MLIHLEKLGKSFGEKVVLHDVSASVEKEDRIGIVGQNGAGKTTLLKILTGVYTDYDGEFSVTHGVTLGYLEQNAKLDTTLDIYGEMRSSFAPVLDAMAQMQILEKKMAASPDDAALLEKHDELQNIIDAADGVMVARGDLGVEIDKRKIVMDDIKTFGTVQAEVKVYAGITAKIFVQVTEA